MYVIRLKLIDVLQKLPVSCVPVSENFGILSVLVLLRALIPEHQVSSAGSCVEYVELRVVLEVKVLSLTRISTSQKQYLQMNDNFLPTHQLLFWLNLKNNLQGLISLHSHTSIF